MSHYDRDPIPTYPARFILAGLALVAVCCGLGALLVQAVRG